MHIRTEVGLPSAWQIVQGTWEWYVIEQGPDGCWQQQAGPFWTRDEARDPFRSEPDPEPTGPPQLLRPVIAYGLHDWYVVIKANSCTWAQLAGPFDTRDEARDWLKNRRSSHRWL
jgi:hypothetical protein